MKLPFNYDATQRIFDNANSLKRNLTRAEKVLWNHLRNRKLDGKKFRRQHPIGPYIVDFYCHSHSLVIEVDGIIHEKEDIPSYDENRTQHLRSLGLSVVRVSNEEVLFEIGQVLAKIRDEINKR